MKKFIIGFSAGCFVITVLFISIALWAGSDFAFQVNQSKISEFEKRDWNRICYRENGEIFCGGIFQEEFEKIEKTIKNNRIDGVKIISVKAHLTGWVNIYCDYFHIIAIDILWPVRWLEKEDFIGAQK